MIMKQVKDKWRSKTKELSWRKSTISRRKMTNSRTITKGMNKKLCPTRQLPLSNKFNNRKKMNRFKLNLWQRWPLMTSQLQPISNPSKFKKNKKRVTSSFLRIRKSKLLRRPKMMGKMLLQQKTLNKNKLNKIIKLRIEFKFEKVWPKKAYICCIFDVVSTSILSYRALKKLLYQILCISFIIISSN